MRCVSRNLNVIVEYVVGAMLHLAWGVWVEIEDDCEEEKNLLGCTSHEVCE